MRSKGLKSCVKHGFYEKIKLRVVFDDTMLRFRSSQPRILLWMLALILCLLGGENGSSSNEGMIQLSYVHAASTIPVPRGLNENNQVSCAACKAILNELRNIMDESVEQLDNDQETMEVGSFRVAPDGKQRGKQKILYARSETHTSTVLHTACKGVVDRLRAVPGRYLDRESDSLDNKTIQFVKQSSAEYMVYSATVEAAEKQKRIKPSATSEEASNKGAAGTHGDSHIATDSDDEHGTKSKPENEDDDILKVKPLDVPDPSIYVLKDNNLHLRLQSMCDNMVDTSYDEILKLLQSHKTDSDAYPQYCKSWFNLCPPGYETDTGSTQEKAEL